MAGNKVNSKTKTKEDKTKANRNSSPSNEESEDLDFTLLRKPVHTSITGFAQARKVFDLATEEFKGLLTNECDILYECKVCRNIFRSLANFISHKRIYCKERFDTSVHGHFLRTLSVASEISRIKKLEELYKESLREDDLGIINEKELDERIPLTKDLTEIIERLSITKGKKSHQHENPEVILQRIPKSNVAVFQNIKSNSDNNTDLMRTQVKELNTIMSRENAVLNNEGKVEVQTALPSKRPKEPESVIQISDDEDNEGDILKCKICDLQFSTQKTLKFHMKYKHLESRLVYPCPDCLEIFSTSWSVYRHLFKVHRKTAAQIRRLRESIQAKAFRMNNPPAFYEKRKNNAKITTTQKITEEERLDQENQAWMDNLEGDGEVPRCGGCGRTFERRAALAAHTHTCQPRSRALARRPADSRKIEIQIRKDYNKVPPPSITLPLKIIETSDNKQLTEEPPEKAKLVEDKEKGAIIDKKSKDNIQNKSHEISLPKESNDESQNNKNKLNEFKSTVKLPFAHQIEMSNFNALSKQCLTDVEIDKLQCKKCDNKFTKIADLYDHMAEHYKWLRYACKLCNFKHYNFEKLPEHVKVVHKLKGDTDFYYSTVKAIDGIEALHLSECSKDTNDANENSPDSRRPSRCSSDSSRLSDDSSSSSTRVEGTRKRKIKHNKIIAKKKKDPLAIEDLDGLKDSETSNDALDENESSSNIKIFEENSSDIDEVDDKSTKKSDDKTTATISTRRPVRKRTNKKNEDFEYDLSNLLKMEAQGYRDSQIVVAPKSIPAKKKIAIENQNNNDNVNKDHCGALAGLSKKAVAVSAAHMRCNAFCAQSEVRASNVFLRPSLPKVTRVEKISPKKDTQMQVLDIASPNKGSTKQDDVSPINSEKDLIAEPSASQETIIQEQDEDTTVTKAEIKDTNSPSEDIVSIANDLCEPTIGKLNVPTVLPLKLRRQSLDLIKNPLIKKNITDFSKAGMKTKILVIKPINRNKDGGKSLNSPLKFQTIKLKDPMKSSGSSKEKLTDQVRVVQVPKVDCSIKLPITNTCIVKNDMNVYTPTNADVVNTVSTTDNNSVQPSSETGESKEIANTNKTKVDISTVKEISSTDNFSRPEDQCLSKNYRTSPTAS